MQTTYTTAFVCFSFGVSLLAQVPETPLPPDAANDPSYGTNFLVASNLLHNASIVWLPDQPEETSAPTQPTVDWAVAGIGAMVPAGGTVQVVSTNGQNVVTIRLANQPTLLLAGADGMAPAGNSPQPMGATGPCIRPGSGLIGWWQAEANALDSVGTHHGQRVNGDTYAAGKVGNAFDLNTGAVVNQSVQIPYSSGLTSAAFTIEAWVCPSRQPSGQAFIFGQSYGRQLVVSPGTGGLNVSFFITSTSGVFYGVSSTQVIPTAGWTHLAGTWDGTNLNLYINGTKNRSANPPLSAIGNSGCAFSIGGINNSCSYYGQYFPGQIDEVSLYDRALLAGEINAICLAGFAGKCKTAPVCAARPAGVVAWWPGEVDASDVLGDMHGTIQNGAACVPGFRGQGFSFNGSQQAVEIPAAPALFASSFTIEAWVKPASRVDGALGQAFIFGQSWGRQLVVRNGVLGLRVAFVICTAPWTFYEVDCSGDIPIGEWTHLIGTFDGDGTETVRERRLGPAGPAKHDSVGSGLRIPHRRDLRPCRKLSLRESVLQRSH